MHTLKKKEHLDLLFAMNPLIFFHFILEKNRGSVGGHHLAEVTSW